MAKQQGQKDYVAQVCNYIETNYSSQITVSGISETLGVERTYLSKLFRKKTGMSIGEYLMNIRFSHAEEFLKNRGNSLVTFDDKTLITTDLEKAMDVFCTCLKLAALEKMLAD